MPASEQRGTGMSDSLAAYRSSSPYAKSRPPSLCRIRKRDPLEASVSWSANAVSADRSRYSLPFPSTPGCERTR
jgi:hypothetical protein